MKALQAVKIRNTGESPVMLLQETSLKVGPVQTRGVQGGVSEAKVDRLLVERVQKVDKRAFDLLIQKYQHRIISLVSRYVSESSEAQDVSQEAFIKAYLAIARFRGGRTC